MFAFLQVDRLQHFLIMNRAASLISLIVMRLFHIQHSSLTTRGDMSFKLKFLCYFKSRSLKNGVLKDVIYLPFTIKKTCFPIVKSI